MKVEVSTKEFMSLISESEMANIKTKIAGMILATVDSEELQEAIEKRVTRKAGERMQTILEDAIRHTKGWGRDQLTGWGADIMRDEFRNQIKLVDFDRLIRSIVTEELKKQESGWIRQTIHDEVAKIVNGDLLESYKKQMESVDFKKMIQEEVQKRFNQVLT